MKKYVDNKKINGLAITSFILGLMLLIITIFPRIVPAVLDNIYASSIFLFYLPILLSIVFGIVVLIRKDKSFKSKVFAILGLALSTLTILIIVVSFVLLAQSSSKF